MEEPRYTNDNLKKIFIQQRLADKMGKALLRMIRDHIVKETEIGEILYYIRNEEKQRRGLAKVIGRHGLRVVVKHEIAH